MPDERLNVLGEMYHTKKIVPAVIEFVDIAGLVKGASKGEDLETSSLPTFVRWMLLSMSCGALKTAILSM